MRKILLIAAMTIVYVNVFAQNTGIGTITPQRKLHIAGGIRIDTLAGAGDGIIKFDNNGDIVRYPLSGNVADVLRGDGSWGIAGSTSLPAGTIVGTPLYNNTALVNIGYSLIGELPVTAYDHAVNETFSAGRWAPTFITGRPDKTSPLEPSMIPGVVWAPETGRMYVCNGGYIQSYDPLADQWDSVSLFVFVFFPPGDLKVVWSGTQLIAWGGYAPESNTNGVCYTPSTNTWQTITTVNQPTIRSGYTMVWAGNRVIIWGGQDIHGNILNDGAMYDPVTDTWTTISTASRPSVRKNHTAVWASSSNGLLIWGGSSTVAGGPGELLNDGALFRPATNTWIAPVNPTGAPSARHKHTAVWTGTEMIIYGGNDNTLPLNNGSRYNPASGGTWTSIPPMTLGFGIYDHAATWTGSAMVVTGGVGSNGPTQAVSNYDLATNSWYTTFYPSYSTFAKRAKYRHYSLLANNIIIIFGGFDEASGNDVQYPPTLVPSNTGYRLFLASTVASATFLSPSAKMYLYIKN
jgi:hypothetical protein